MSSVVSIQLGIRNPFRVIAYWLTEKVLAINEKTLPYPYSDLYVGLVFGEDAPDDFVKFPPILNSMMASVVAAEAAVLKHVNLPFGVSILAIAKKMPMA